ncbi:MAG TPA: hemerythrin domain-containing protein [Polyangiaceae bacterium]|jgi:hemerythrin-like domain-containing protein|nr:hemerythrin domain-containing protein [Polyangiaceae bacterium]
MLQNGIDMHDNGIIHRILIVYDEAARRIDEHASLDLAPIARAASIVSSFVHDCHETLEEQLVFPRLLVAHREAELSATLLRQHRRGRELTDAIIRSARTSATFEMGHALRSFSRMYRPHAAHEDTVLFPAFRALVGRVGYRELSEQFKDEERRLFGERDSENALIEIVKIETAFGLADLAEFTP